MLSFNIVFKYMHIIIFWNFIIWHLDLDIGSTWVKKVDEFVVKQLEYKANIMKGNIFNY